MNCRNFEENAVGYIDGLLTRETSVEMENHLCTCKACANVIASHRAVIDSLNSAEMVKAPSWLADSILAAVSLQEIAVTEAALSKTVTCDVFENNIAAYVEGNLDEKLLLAMNEHRASCRACEQLAHSHEVVFTSLVATERVSAPAGLTDSIFEAIEQHEIETASAAAYSSKKAKFWRLTAAFAAASSFVASISVISNMIINNFPVLTQYNALLPKASLVAQNARTLLPDFQLQALLAKVASIAGALRIQVSGLPLNEMWHNSISSIFEPVTLPMLSQPIPLYYLAIVPVMIWTMWMYFASPMNVGSQTSGY